MKKNQKGQKQEGSMQTRRGAVSFYAVIFTALIMSVVTLSFVRLMLSEQSQTSGDDQSESAYDAALAGVEDAKTWLKQCMVDGDYSDCNFVSSLADANCDKNNMINVWENGGAVDAAGDEYYTCVLMSDVTEDYRVTIAGDSQKVAMVPIKTAGGENSVDTIEIEWSSSGNNGLGEYLLPIISEKSQPVRPAIVTAQLIDGKNPSTNWGDGKSRSSLLTFRPTLTGSADSLSDGKSTDNSDGVSSISSSQVEAGAKEDSVNQIYNVKCTVGAARTTCKVRINLSGDYNDNGDLLLLGVPYGGDGADFSVVLKKNGSVVNFQGAQVAVDSTGRTNDRYRRVESRVALSNVAIYPEFALSLSGDGSDDSGALNKNFFVTRNCWTSNGTEVKTCKNSGTI